MLNSKLTHSVVLPRFQFGRNVNSRRIRQIHASFDATPLLPEPRSNWWRTPYDNQILNLAIPTICSNILTPLSSVIDAGVVGRLGACQLSGVGLGSMAFSFITGFLYGIPLLVTPMIAQKDSRGESVSSDIAGGLWLTFIVGSCTSILILLSSNSVLNVLQPSVESRPFAEVYLKTLAFLPPAALVFQCLGGVYRGLRDSQSVLKASGCAVLINLVFDLVFVFGFNGSVMGVGLATIISIYTSAGILIYQLISQGRLKISDLKKCPEFARFLPLLNDGLRLGLRSVLIIGVLLMSSALIARTTAVLHSAYEICRLTSLLTYVVYMSIEQTMQALGATAIGRGDLTMGRAIITRTMQLSVGICSFTVITLLMFSPQVAGLFSSDPSVIAAFVAVAPFHLLSMPFSAVVAVIDGALIGAQRNRVVANSQSIGAAMGILAFVFLQRSNLVTLIGVWIVVRCATSLHGVVTGHYLFLSKNNPYNFGKI